MKKYKIIDSIIYSGEAEMLALRLDYLYDKVDYFIICEGNVTFSGENKNIKFLEDYQYFERFKDKIKFVIYEATKEDLELNKDNSFHIENQQREKLRTKILESADKNTLILISDVDEIPNSEVFDEMYNKVKDTNLDMVSLKLKTYYYSPLCEVNIECYGTVGLNYDTLKQVTKINDLREYRFNSSHIENGGYHLSFFMSPEQIQHKIKSFSHQEYNTPKFTDIQQIKYRMHNGIDMFDRSECPITLHKEISNKFPLEFYRHEIFYRNTFDRLYLKSQSKLRRDNAMQIALEIENLQLTVAKHNPKVIVEIGTANGGTLARWLEIPSVETIISIDYPIGIHGGQGFEERTYVISDALEQANLHDKKFYAVNGDSKHPYLINRVEELLNDQKIDFLFIDGDHTYEGVKGDFELYERFLSPNALVGFHDIINSEFHREANCFVSTFWDELKEKYSSKEFIYTNLLDKYKLPFFYDYSLNKGGFAGIGYIDYSKKKEYKPDLTLIVPVYNNVDDTINNIKTTLSNSTLINQVIIYSNGTDKEGNKKLKEFSNTNPIIELHIVNKAIGFVKAVNESYKLSKNEHILCLNSDANLYSNWEDLLLPLINNKKYGIVGPVKYNDFILGCCFIVKKSLLNKIGLLNEGFGLGYVDDKELSYRVKNNGYELGYICTIQGDDWNPHVSFPLNHKQGESFKLLSSEKTKGIVEYNNKKFDTLLNSSKVIVLKNLPYEKIKSHFNTNKPIIIINESGDNFEKIRFDEEIIKTAHVYECTKEMNINTLILSLTKNKIYTVIEDTKPNITWLAKYDDHASMGILSQRILEQLDKKDYNLACKAIIGETKTNNPLIHSLLNKTPNKDIGIMFSYPDMIGYLNEFKTKIIYTGVDTTDEAGNFVENSNKADFLITPSKLSKQRIENMGVKKPVFVLPHGIDPEIFKYTERINTDIFKFLYVGEASDRKGIFHLLKAFISLFKNNPKAELHIKSNTDMLFYNSKEVQDLIKDHKNIFWHLSDEGHNKVIELYKECHAYVYPSRGDSFGMTLLEAMACGLPIITTKLPGATDVVDGKVTYIKSKLVPVTGHPWFKGEWGEPDLEDLKSKMKSLYKNYDTSKLKEYSDFIRENYSWEKITDIFEQNILPNFEKRTRVLTLLTSYNRPHHIKNIIQSLKDIREDDVINDIYIVENSDPEYKEECLNIINKTTDGSFILYNSKFNLGQRGSLLQMLDDINVNEYDYIQFTDQDNLFLEPISTYCNILAQYPKYTVSTGYMSKEHTELDWIKSQWGNLCEKRTCRAGHMVFRVSDIKNMMPIYLDRQYNEPRVNSSWNAGLDWELTYWNPKSPGFITPDNFIICLPGGVIHKGIDSTIYDWPVEENEYTLEELKNLRNKFI